MKTKEQLIKLEEKRLKKLYEPLSDNKKVLMKGLIENAAFMKVTLDELQVKINASGCSEYYQNGENQGGQKASADLQAYNQLMKNYLPTIDKLNKALPEEAREKSKLMELIDE